MNLLKYLPKNVLRAYRSVFGKTNLETRLADIAEEADELVNYTDEVNLREELGDLITSCLCLVEEKGWSLTDLIDENVNKVLTRHKTGHYDKTREALEPYIERTTPFSCTAL